MKESNIHIFPTAEFVPTDELSHETVATYFDTQQPTSPEQDIINAEEQVSQDDEFDYKDFGGENTSTSDELWDQYSELAHIYGISDYDAETWLVKYLQNVSSTKNENVDFMDSGYNNQAPEDSSYEINLPEEFVSSVKKMIETTYIKPSQLDWYKSKKEDRGWRLKARTDIHKEVDKTTIRGKESL
jgi:hypothetical protein